MLVAKSGHVSPPSGALSASFARANQSAHLLPATAMNATRPRRRALNIRTGFQPRGKSTAESAPAASVMPGYCQSRFFQLHHFIASRFQSNRQVSPELGGLPRPPRSGCRAEGRGRLLIIYYGAFPPAPLHREPLPISLAPGAAVREQDRYNGDRRDTSHSKWLAT